jgi:hypothetical protein
MNTAVRWAAELAHVREVSLLGTADLAFWKQCLRKELLLPAEKDGQAQLLIVATDSKYLGVRFRELSFSVLVRRDERGCRPDGAFLVHALNSCRLFAFCERVLFSTPYYYGDCRVATSFPATIQWVDGGEAAFRAEMRGDASGRRREPSRSGEGGWEGPVYLPTTGRGKGPEGRLFFARIRGRTLTYPFLNTEDSVSVRPSPGSPILQALMDSRFAGKEWAVRQDATHAKSKTYKRSDLIGSGLGNLATAAP